MKGESGGDQQDQKESNNIIAKTPEEGAVLNNTESEYVEPVIEKSPEAVEEDSNSVDNRDRVDEITKIISFNFDKIAELEKEIMTAKQNKNSKSLDKLENERNELFKQIRSLQEELGSLSSKKTEKPKEENSTLLPQKAGPRYNSVKDMKLKFEDEETVNPGVENENKEVIIPEEDMLLAEEREAELADPKKALENGNLDVLRDPEKLRVIMELPEDFTEVQLKEHLQKLFKTFDFIEGKDRRSEIEGALKEGYSRLELKEKEEAKKSSVSSNAEEVASIQPEETDSNTVTTKLDSKLENDIKDINNREKIKGIGEKSFNWLQKNSKLRMATGIAVSGIAAFTGTTQGIWLAKGLTGAISGATFWSGFKSGRREKGAMADFNEFEAEIQDCFYNGNFNEQLFNQKIADGDISRKFAIDIYAELTEVATAKGKAVISSLERKEEQTGSTLEKYFPKLSENKFVKIYDRFDWKIKAAFGVAVSVGAGYAGAFAAKSVGMDLEWIKAIQVLSSGAVQLGLGALQKTPEGNSPYYAHSDEILKIKSIIEEKLGGDLDDKEILQIKEYRNNIKKNRKTDAVIGGLTVAALVGGAYAYFGHNAPDHGNPTTNKPSGVPAPDGKTVPHATVNDGGIKIDSHDSKISTEPPTGPKTAPLAPGTQAPEVKGLKPEDLKNTGIHLKSEYLEKTENIDGVNADKHLAETVIRGEMGQPGKYGEMHFNNHDDFEKFRDKLVTEMHAKHPDAFNPDGSINQHHIKEVPNLLDTQEVKTDYAAFATLHPATTTEVPSGSGHELNSDANHDTKNAIEDGHKAVPLQQAEATSRNELLQATGAKVPPTWHASHNFESYNNGKSITESGVMDIFKDKQISKDSSNYLQALYKSGTLKPGDIHVSADGKHLLMNAPDSMAKGIVWVTDIKDKSIFSSLFPGRTVDVNSILPEKPVSFGAVTQPLLNHADSKPVGLDTHAPINSSGGRVQEYTAENADVSASPEVNHNDTGAVNPIEQSTPPHTQSSEIKAEDVVPAPEVPIIEDIPLNSSSLRSVDNLHNYSVNIQGQDPISLPGTRVNELILEAKKYFIDHNAKFQNSLQENNSIWLYILGQLKKK